MSPFKVRSVERENSLSQKLRKARENLGLSLDSAARQLNVNKIYLQNIEDGAWQNLPGEFYAQTFTKKYALALGLNWKKTAEELNKELEKTKKWGGWEKNNKTKVQRTRFLVVPKLVQKFSIAVVVLIFLSYLGYQILNITKPPKLLIFTPDQERVAQKDPKITISGQTDPEAKIKINSQEISPDQTGFFSLSLDLSAGLNIIKVETKKRYSRTTSITKEIIVNQE
jgi:cytoskeletal protein RodZ